MYETTYIKSRTLIIACILTVCFPCIGFAGAAAMTEQQTQELFSQAKNTILQTDAALIGIKQIRQDLINSVMTTAEMLETMEQKATAHFKQIEALRESDQGKLLAQDPNSMGFAIFLLLYEEPAITVNEINEKQLLLASLQKQVLLGISGPEVGYLPKREIRDQVTLLEHWAKDRQKAFDDQIATLNRLLRRQPPERLDTSQGITLNDKLDKRNAVWDELVAIIRLMAEEEVKPEVKEILLELYKYVKLEEGKLRADILKGQEDLSLARKRQEHEIEIQDDTFLLERVRRLADQNLSKRRANLDNKTRELKAVQNLNQALANLRLNKLETETATQQLIAEAESPDVQSLLRPFITKGYWQPNRAKTGYKLSGMSLTFIKKQDCFSPKNGLQKLLTLGTNPANSDRRPWTFPRKYNSLSHEQKEQLQRAQDYLMKLGPTLVDLGYLAE